MFEAFLSMDRSFFLFLNSLTGNPVIDSLMVFTAEATVFIIPAYLFKAWFDGAEGKKDSIYILLSVFSTLATAFLMGNLFFRKSPFQVYNTVVSGSPENSFPSTHMSFMFGVLLPLIWKVKRSEKFRNFFMVTTLLTGFARIYIGEHYLLDVLGSLLAGIIGSALIYMVESHLNPVLTTLASKVQRFEDSVVKRVF